VTVVRRRAFNPATIVPAALFSLLCYLYYKNGFTRCDYGHYAIFFYAFPMLVVFALLQLHGNGGIFSKALAAAFILVSVMNTYDNPMAGRTVIGEAIFTSVTSVGGYFCGIFTAQPETEQMPIPGDKRLLIGDATIDVFPSDITLAQLNNLNYYPRPTLQTAYSPALDSLDGFHFYNPGRPEMVIMKNKSIDHKYPLWEESFTKAVLHLNYEYYTYFSLTGDSLNDQNISTFLVLKSKPGKYVLPEFVKVTETTVALDSVCFYAFNYNFPLYMTADIQYTAFGTLKKWFYQPPLLDVVFVMDSGAGQKIRAVRPLLQEPELINKLVENNVDLKNFMSGDLSKLRTIKGFIFQPRSAGFKDSIKVTFWAFRNY
jgi:hypothetical protein